MDAAAFQSAIYQCGYDNPTATYLTSQGFTTTMEFQQFPINKFKNMMKAIAKDLPNNVTFPYMAELKFQGF